MIEGMEIPVPVAFNAVFLLSTLSFYEQLLQQL